MSPQHCYPHPKMFKKQVTDSVLRCRGCSMFKKVSQCPHNNVILIQKCSKSRLGTVCCGVGDADWLKALVGADCASKADRDANFHRNHENGKILTFYWKYTSKADRDANFHRNHENGKILRLYSKDASKADRDANFHRNHENDKILTFSSKDASKADRDREAWKW